MSVTVMSLVFEYDMPELKTDDDKTVPDSTLKFILLALADHASEDGENAYIGVRRLCRKTNFSTSTVCNALNALRHNGYTELVGKSKKETNNYTIILDRFQPPKSEDSSHRNSTIPATEAEPSFNHPLTILADSKTEEEAAAEYNVELMRGDFHDYPERLWEYARVLRDVWMFRLPEKTQKKSKGQYGFFVMELEAIKDACAEFGADVMVKVHEDWKDKFRNGIAPYTVAKPSSLVNVCAGKARELRDAPKDTTPQYKPLPEDNNVYVPNPNHR